ncbi:MAG TPA: hypothetical protein VEC01_17695 [Noviherbaspirillum sp.]|uniref:hypothetical protein n=1 Tax=Noviherbaspirillum sp. TaxID=1926288 RepID=UPI002D6E306A|nr:hypothetical protein [Noviherbaspirillum sp.]HYD97164.1 hypothetical protein [Noviherbaspirillum sp.]
MTQGFREERGGGELEWLRYLCYGLAPEQMPAPRFAAVLEQATPARDAVVLRNGWAITSRRIWDTGALAVADEAGYAGTGNTVMWKVDRPLLPARFGLVVLGVGKDGTCSQSSPETASVLGLALVREQLRYYHETLLLQQRYCSEREIGGRPLATIPAVRGQLGESFRQLRLLEEWAPGEPPASPSLSVLTREMRNLGDMLGKPGGARAFLSGGVREAAAMFGMLANLYPGHDHA